MVQGIVSYLQLLGLWLRTWRTLPVLDWVRGASLYRRGHYREAVRLYERGLRRHPHHPAHICARLDLAFCYFKLMRIEESEQQLRYVTVHAPTSREGFLRLARLQLWSGRPHDAAVTMHRALQRIQPDPEMAATLALAAYEHGGPGYLLDAAREAVEAVSSELLEFPRLRLGRAVLQMLAESTGASRTEIEQLASETPALFEAVLVHAELLMKEGKVLHARRHLRRALVVAPDHPRLLSLLAESYLKAGTLYNAEYARQLATDACVASGWLSPREMHILAEAYYHLSDKMGALLLASKAKDAGARLIGSYRDAKHLDALIESLSTQSLA